MPRAAVILTLSLLACSDSGVTVYNTAPVVSIQTPEDGAAYQPGATIDFTGVVRDNQQDPSTLLVSWSSSVDFELGEADADSEGLVRFPVTTLSPGVHAITLKAIDNSGEAGTDTITIDVGYGGEVVGAPTVSLIGPVEGDAYSAGQTITVVATATDDEQPCDTLLATILSSRDGVVWEGSPTSTCAISLDLPDPDFGNPSLSVGGHALSLTVEDDDGNTASATVNITVLEDGRPVVNILTPSDGAGFRTTDTITFTGSVSDDVSDNDAIYTEWSSSIDGVLWGDAPDSSGTARAALSLSEGTHIIELTAWDEDQNDGSDAITVTVIDGLNWDDDGDGQTENQGDCDDADPYTYAGAAYNESSTACMTDADGDGYGDDAPSSGVTAGGDCDDADSSVSPGATEVCDLVDNDCDGAINDGLDSHASEPNDSQAAAVNLGGLDGSWWPWSGGRADVSGLILYNSSDTDWFEFEVEDNILIEDASFTVTVSGLPSTGFYVLDVISADGASPLSAQGTGTLTVSWSDSAWAFSDYDDWYAKVSAQSWVPQACSNSYTLSIVINN